MESQNAADIEEIKTTTKFILKRLDNLARCGEDCQCSSEFVQLHKAFQTVEERVNALQLNATVLQDEETDEQIFDRIQTRLIALEFDNTEHTVFYQFIPDDTRRRPGRSNGSITNASSSVGESADHMAVHDCSGGATKEAVLSVGESENYPLNVSHKHIEHETTEPNESAQGESSTENVDRSKIASTTESAPKPGPNVIRQTNRNYVSGDDLYWPLLAEKQKKEDIRMTRDEEVIRTVLCLDISESMASENAWSQAKTFVNDFLNGLEMRMTMFELIGRTQEYVGLATFGHETKQQLLPTANYTSVRDKIVTANYDDEIFIIPRIIVITDGKPTETSLRGGPDTQTKTDETMTSILECLKYIEGCGFLVFFVGVGDYDEDFLKLVTASEGRKKLFGYQDGRRVAKRTYLCTQTPLFDNSSFTQSGPMQSSKDCEDMQDIRLASRLFKDIIKKRKSKASFENKYDALPVIGSRVRRGPDWMFDGQDNFGPGTIVGHSEHDHKVWVTWDFDNVTAQYRYGMGEYDVLITDEPRELKPGEKIAIGCRVKQGRDARSKYLSGSIEGVVIRMDITKAKVRWDNDTRGDYSYGTDGRNEIELW